MLKMEKKIINQIYRKTDIKEWAMDRQEAFIEICLCCNIQDTIPRTKEDIWMLASLVSKIVKQRRKIKSEKLIIS